MPPSEAQLNYIVYELGVTNAEAGELLGRDPQEQVTKISRLTRRDAFLLISNKLDSLVRTFHPDAEADVNIDLTTEADGLEYGYRGRAIIQHYETVYTEDGLYLNVVFFLPGAQRTIKRSLKFFAKNAKLLTPDANGEAEAEKVIARFHRLQGIFNTLNKKFWARWQRLLHARKFQTKVLQRDFITTEQKFKLIKHAIEAHLEPLVLRDENPTEKEIDEALCESAHFVVRG